MSVITVKKERFEGFEEDPNYFMNSFAIPFSSIIKRKKDNDIYNGREKIPFKNRHPTYKALLKLEFEDALKDYSHK